MRDKIIGLADADNFFAGCEILMNPELQGRPVCVLSNNDGCVISRSNEAKQLGIKMGAPYFLAKKEFPDALYLSSNFALYHDMSGRLMKILRNYTDKLDIYSIDEAFLDLTGCDKIFKMTFNELAAKIRNDIKQNLGLSVSAGISCSKTLAKLAAEKAKRMQSGFFLIEKHSIKDELKNLPVEEIWGIGANTSRSLKAAGIFYADEILQKDDNFFRIYYGKKGLELKYELMGESVIPLTGIEEKPKSIQKTRAFPKFSKDMHYIAGELSMHLCNVCRKLRANNLQAGFLGVMLRTKDFRVYGREMKLDFYTSSELELAKYARRLFESIYTPNVIYRASGIYAGLFRDSIEHQLDLFQNASEIKREKLPYLLDKIENKYGRGIISFGSRGIQNADD